MPPDFSNFHPPNPFLSDLAPEGPVAEGDCVALHAGALEDLEEMLAVARNASPDRVGNSGGGQVVLLRAPRAGFGKSHLLGRLRSRAAGEQGAFVLGVNFDPEGGIAWKSALRQLLEQWHAPASGEGPSTLDLIARKVFSLLNADLIREGKVPCAQPTLAIRSMERDYAAMFDFADRRQAVGQWFQENFEPLLEAGLPYLKIRTALPEPLLATCLRALCGYAQGGAEGDPRRLDTLDWALRQASGAVSTRTAQSGFQLLTAPAEDGNFHRELLTALCRLAALGRPVLVLLDHLDGFYNNPGDLLRLGRLITDWRRLSGRTVLVLSVNEDLWAGTFQKALPSALEDRLTGSEVTLGGINPEEAAALIRSRLVSARVPPALAQGFAAQVDLPGFFAARSMPGALLSPRAVLRHASQSWKAWWKPGDSPAPAGSAFASFPAAPLEPPAYPSWATTLTPLPLSIQSPNPEPVWPTAVSQAVPAVMTDKRFHEQTTWPEAEANFIHRADSPSATLPPLPPPQLPPVGFVHTSQPSARSGAQENTLSGRFQRLRAHFASAPLLGLDHDRLHRLVKWSGQRLAVLRCGEVHLPGLPGRKITIWRTPDGEVLFGAEPHGDTPYWTALLSAARQRVEAGPASRLVIFTTPAAPVNLGAWLPQDEIVSARARFLDLQSLTQGELAVLYAADEVLREAERGVLAVGSSDAFAAMAPYLEFFWKRLTRPLLFG